MRNGIPETMEEAIRLIAEQNRELHDQRAEIQSQLEEIKNSKKQ